MLAAARRQLLDPDPEFRHFEQTSSLSKSSGLLDWLIAVGDERHDPEDVFGRLRWGGKFVFLCRDRREVAEMSRKFSERGFVTEPAPTFLRTGWGLPLLSPKAHLLVARKTYLIRPREFSDRFTYQVELEKRPESQAIIDPTATRSWIVRKEVPTFERVLARLKSKAPDLPASTLERRARKFVEQIFPLFLTREAAMLRLIERDCPDEYRNRFPTIVRFEKDGKGYVQKLWTTWLRNEGPALPQIEFAKQAANLVHILHDRVGIIHLDLRMDNMVITEHGVGFVDFGSAVRVNENIHSNAVLSTLFGELMRTSQIQRMLDRMSTAGSVTSHVIREAHQRADKAVDLFYLAVQISDPITNPDLRELIRFEKFSLEAMELAKLNAAILRPVNPTKPRFRTACDVLREIERIEADLKSGRLAQANAAAAKTAKPVKPKVWIWK